MSAAVLFAGQTPAGCLWPGPRSAPAINVHASMIRLRRCPQAALPSPDMFLVPTLAVAALALMQLRSDESAAKPLQQPRAPARDWRAKLGQFQVVALPGKGLGAVALCRFEPGDLVAEEAPLLQLTQSGSPAEQFQSLSAEARQRILNLSDFAAEKTVQGILDTNCFQKGLGSEDRVLCPTLARFNHSCVPNCQHVWDSDAAVMRILASTEVVAGEELSVDYIDVRQSREQRQALLSRKYGFKCTCASCQSADEESDRRRLSMARIDAEIGSASAEEALRLAQRLLRLYDDEGLHLQALRGRAALDACAACAKRGDAQETAAWASRAAESYSRGLGPGHELVRRALVYAASPESHRSWRR
ncbi:set5 [Symbiodinium sp. CCMP2456]|nr:set5 [Symbiodinium sp. CCMP2456]